MVVLILIGLFLTLLGVLLITPIEIEIDSIKNKYLVRWKGVAGGQFLFKDHLPVLRINFFMFKKEISLLAKKTKSGKAQKKDNQKVKKSSKKKRPFKWYLRKSRLLFRSFKVEEFKLILDTDDYILNAYLYPVFYFLNKGNRNLSINFEGNFELKLLVKNRLIRLIGAFLR